MTAYTADADSIANAFFVLPSSSAASSAAIADVILTSRTWPDDGAGMTLLPQFPSKTTYPTNP